MIIKSCRTLRRKINPTTSQKLSLFWKRLMNKSLEFCPTRKWCIIITRWNPRSGGVSKCCCEMPINDRFTSGRSGHLSIRSDQEPNGRAEHKSEWAEWRGKEKEHGFDRFPNQMRFEHECQIKLTLEKWVHQKVAVTQGNGR